MLNLFLLLQGQLTSQIWKLKVILLKICSCTLQTQICHKHEEIYRGSIEMNKNSWLEPMIVPGSETFIKQQNEFLKWSSPLPWLHVIRGIIGKCLYLHNINIVYRIFDKISWRGSLRFFLCTKLYNNLPKTTG